MYCLYLFDGVTIQDCLSSGSSGCIYGKPEKRGKQKQTCIFHSKQKSIKNNEIFIVGMHIGEYSHSGYATHEPTRERKLLMHKVEISKIKSKFETKGITIVPLKLYFKKGKAKIEIALAKGKKKWDKRETIKKRDIDREIKRSMKGN